MMVFWRSDLEATSSYNCQTRHFRTSSANLRLRGREILDSTQGEIQSMYGEARPRDGGH